MIPATIYPDPPFTLDIEWLHLFDEWVAEMGEEDATYHAGVVFDHEFAERLHEHWKTSA